MCHWCLAAPCKGASRQVPLQASETSAWQIGVVGFCRSLLHALPGPDRKAIPYLFGTHGYAVLLVLFVIRYMCDVLTRVFCM